MQKIKLFTKIITSPTKIYDATRTHIQLVGISHQVPRVDSGPDQPAPPDNTVAPQPQAPLYTNEDQESHINPQNAPFPLLNPYSLVVIGDHPVVSRCISLVRNMIFFSHWSEIPTN